MTNGDNNSNRMLQRVASILDVVEYSPGSASELARRTGLSVSTVHRLALSMVEYGFLRRSEDGNFKPGYRLVRTTLESAALPVLTGLRDETGETVQLWIRRGDVRICQLSVDSVQELKATLPVGSRLKLPNGSSGRLLSNDPEALDAIATQGWVESVARRTPGLGSVSAPLTARGRIIAVVCLAVPLSRVSGSPGSDFGAQVAAAAAAISAEMELILN